MKHLYKIRLFKLLPYYSLIQYVSSIQMVYFFLGCKSSQLVLVKLHCYIAFGIGWKPLQLLCAVSVLSCKTNNKLLVTEVALEVQLPHTKGAHSLTHLK
jgi:hypothetical protein